MAADTPGLVVGDLDFGERMMAIIVVTGATESENWTGCASWMIAMSWS